MIWDLEGVATSEVHPYMETSDLEGPRVISKAILFGAVRTGKRTSTKIGNSSSTKNSNLKKLLASRIGGHFQSDSLSKVRAVVKFTHFVFFSAFGFDSFGHLYIYTVLLKD